MKILLISPYFAPAVGGVETHLTDLCNYFESKKHTVYVRTYKALGTKDRGLSNENSKYVKIHRLWWPDFNLVFKLEPYALLRTLYIGLGLFIDCFLFLLQNSKAVDVIQVHGFIAALWSLPLAKIFKKRFVVNTHVGFKFDSQSLMTKLISKVILNSDTVLVLTKNAKQALVSIGLPESKIFIYHYWVDQSRFKHTDNIKKKLGWENKFVVLFVGRLVEVKGINTIINLAKKIPNITFAIAGSGPMEESIKYQVLSIKNLIYLGKVDQNKLPAYYSAADLQLVPSKIIEQTFEEGIPRVMIEALSCGLPIISTPSGGIPDVFNEKIGKLVEDKESDIEKAIYFYYKNRDELKKTARNCRSYALINFGIKNAQTIEKSLN
jgi:glycosyltransferase involved in cell wall biosynthesis